MLLDGVVPDVRRNGKLPSATWACVQPSEAPVVSSAMSPHSKEVWVEVASVGAAVQPVPTVPPAWASDGAIAMLQTRSAMLRNAPAVPQVAVEVPAFLMVDLAGTVW